MDVTARRSTAHDDAGFSLVEVVMAMLVLTVAILALIPVQTRALAGVVAAEQRQQAAGFANGALERVRATTATPTGFASVIQGRAPSSGETYTSGETLVTTAGTSPDGALVTRTCSEQSGCVVAPATVTGTPFTTTLYVSQPASPVPGLYTVTAVASWTSTVSGASISHRVVLRTRVSAPGVS